MLSPPFLTQVGDDLEWLDWFTWQEEGRDWRRVVAVEEAEEVVEAEGVEELAEVEVEVEDGEEEG